MQSVASALVARSTELTPNIASASDGNFRSPAEVVTGLDSHCRAKSLATSRRGLLQMIIRARLTMLAYDMNDEPLPFGHGAPLRLRNEIELGFKQVKWIKGVEFVAHFSEVGSGYGGYNQDHEFFGYRQSI